MPHIPGHIAEQTRAPFLTGETFLPEQKITAFEDLRTSLSDPFTQVQPILQTLLESLRPGEDIARRNLADEFRKAGATSDASRAVAGAQLETGLQRTRGTTAAEGFLKFLSPLLQGRAAALSGIPGGSRRFGFQPGPSTRELNQRSTAAARRQQGLFAGGGAAANNLQAALQAQASREQLFPRTPTEPLTRFTQAPEPPSFAPPSSGAVAFGPGAGSPEDFGFGGTGSPDQPFTGLPSGFGDFSQEDQDFFFGR